MPILFTDFSLSKQKLIHYSLRDFGGGV